MKYFALKIVALLFIFTSCKSEDDSPLPQQEPEIPDFETTGSVESISTFGGTKNESAKTVIKTSDGGYAVVGYTQSMDGDVIDKSDESYDAWLLKFDADNNLLWNKTYGGSNDENIDD